jgi:hypothetical protein
MSDTSAFGFGQFVPGFDFLQNLSKTAAQAQPGAAAAMPGMANWVAPTLSIEDIDKRIQELKSVLFWLEQNTTALKATIQAMEVQKMTLSTLQSMNVNMADLAKAFTVKPPVAEPAPSSFSATAAAATSEPAPAAVPKPSLFKPKPAAPPTAPEPANPEPEASAEPQQSPNADPADAQVAKSAVDPMQWWGALTQQFQGIAAAALKDVAAEAMKTGMSAKNAKASTGAARSKSAASKSRSAKAGALKTSDVKVPTHSKRASKSTAKSALKDAVKSGPRNQTRTSAAASRKSTPK